jgi:hypothetical protein
VLGRIPPELDGGLYRYIDMKHKINNLKVGTPIQFSTDPDTFKSFYKTFLPYNFRWTKNTDINPRFLPFVGHYQETAAEQYIVHVIPLMQ